MRTQRPERPKKARQKRDRAHASHFRRNREGVFGVGRGWVSWALHGVFFAIVLYILSRLRSVMASDEYIARARCLIRSLVRGVWGPDL